jgi:predicted nucleotidyltransferase
MTRLAAGSSACCLDGEGRLISASKHRLRITGGTLHVMQAPASPLLPLLRSRLQAELLTVVLLTPGREWSLTELADRAGSSLSSAQREMARAEEAGVISSRRLGSTRLVTVAHSPLTGPLTELLLRSFGPRQVVAEELAGVAGIESAFLFGSWAARYAGQPGRAPADIDVLVIGDPDRDELDDAAQRAGARLAREVNGTIRSLAWWREGGDGFQAEVTGRPLVPVFAEPGDP